MHAEYEPTSTHITKSDRILTYLGFGLCLALTVMLYKEEVDGFNRLSFYLTVIVAFPASWAWLSGHYSKKIRKIVRQIHLQPNLSLVRPLGEATYVYKGEGKPLAEALGYEI